MEGQRKGSERLLKPPGAKFPAPLWVPHHIPCCGWGWDWDPRAKNKPGRDSLEIGLRVNQSRVLSFPLGLCRGLGQRSFSELSKQILRLLRKPVLIHDPCPKEFLVQCSLDRI